MASPAVEDSLPLLLLLTGTGAVSPAATVEASLLLLLLTGTGEVSQASEDSPAVAMATGINQ